jgi:hypothetical protein
MHVVCYTLSALDPTHDNCCFTVPDVSPNTWNGSSSRKKLNVGASDPTPAAIRAGQSTKHSPTPDRSPTVTVLRIENG